jgi:1,2-diacylglycerol 3-alpha-glucosyltransferase
MPTILWLTPGFPAHEQDDTCLPPLQVLARNLAAQSVDIQVIALEYPFGSEPYRWHEVSVWPCGGANRKWLRWRTHARARWYARHLLEKGQVTTLHSFWLAQAWQLGQQLATEYPSVSHLTTLMGQDVLPRTNGHHLRRLQPTDAAHLVALSAFHADQMHQHTGLRPAHLIPWGLDPMPLLLDAPRSLHVLGVGSLLPVKNWSAWLRVVRLVADRRPDLQAELIGEGPLRSTLEREARALGLEGIVRFVGGQSRAAVLRRMQQAHVLLHTSRFESFGMVLLEAERAGCAVVSTSVGIAPSVGATAHDADGLAIRVLQNLERQEVSPGGATQPFLSADTTAAYRRLYGL